MSKWSYLVRKGVGSNPTLITFLDLFNHRERGHHQPERWLIFYGPWNNFFFSLLSAQTMLVSDPEFVIYNLHISFENSGDALSLDNSGEYVSASKTKTNFTSGNKPGPQYKNPPI